MWEGRLVIREMSGMGEPLGDLFNLFLMSDDGATNHKSHSVLCNGFLSKTVGTVVRVSVNGSEELAIAELCPPNVGDGGMGGHPDEAISRNIVEVRSHQSIDAGMLAITGGGSGNASPDSLAARLAVDPIGCSGI